MRDGSRNPLYKHGGYMNYKLIYRNYENGASAFLFDMRNSTRLIRFLSYRTDNKGFSQPLVDHTTLMTNIKDFIRDRIGAFGIGDQYSLNDTGDGHLCVFWDPVHSITCLKVALPLYIYLESTLNSYNKTLKEKYKYSLSVDFGIGIHCGGCVVYRSQKDYIYGIVVNTAARIESQTKQPNSPKLLLSGNFKTFFKEQLPESKKKLISSFKRIQQNRIDVRDEKNKGHFCYKIESIHSFIKQLEAKSHLY
jgi:hypothetical protein